MNRARVTLLLVLAWAGSTCGSGSESADYPGLPGNNAVAGWEMVGAPVEINTEAGLYNRIDGGAPKYIERGWVSSVYAEYRKDGASTRLMAAVHDMGTPAGAEDIFRTYWPAARADISGAGESDPGGRQPNAVVDLGLSGTYSAYGFSNRYYVEVNIDAKTDAALADIKAFVLKMIENAR